MARIVIYDNPLERKPPQVVRHNGPFIDFLTEEYPDGFSLPHTCVYNFQPLKPEDFDVNLKEGDAVGLAFYPADPITGAIAGALGISSFLGQLLVGLAVSLGLSYLANEIFGPSGTAKQPASITDLESADSVYNLAVPTNTIRLGKPVPVAYGRMWLVPDIASQPYRYYLSNDEYVVLLLCLGYGEFEIHDVYVADTPVDQLASGVVTYTVFQPTDHNSTFGEIEADTGERENVYTSPEVTDQELTHGTRLPYGSFLIWSGEWSEQEYTGGIFQALNTDGIYEAIALVNADKCYLKITDSATGNLHDGIYKVAYVKDTKDPIDDDGDLIPELAGDVDFARKGHLEIGEDWENAALTPATVQGEIFDNPDGINNYGIGPFVSCGVGMTTRILNYDFEIFDWYDINPDTGGLLPITITIKWEAEPIDDDGVATGAPIETYIWSAAAATRTPQRYTKGHVVPAARYQVRAYRMDGLADNETTPVKVFWTGLKSILGNTGGSTTYGPVTMMLATIKASEGISSSAHTHFRVDCTRKIDSVSTQNPVDAFYDIYKNTDYGGRRPESELDTTTIDALKTTWAAEEFNAVFDTHSTVWEALHLAIQMQHAAPVLQGAIVSIVVDEEPSVAEVDFSNANVKKVSVVYTFARVGDHDGIEGEYIDDTDGSTQYVIHPSDAADPEKIVLFGCTDTACAEAYVERVWDQRVYRRRLVSIDVEAEGHTIPIGTVLSIEHELLPEGELYVVTGVKTKSEFETTIECFVNEEEIWS